MSDNKAETSGQKRMVLYRPFFYNVAMNPKRQISKTVSQCFYTPLAAVVLLAAAAIAVGLESAGNTDGVLHWNLGTLEAGGSAGQVVIFAYADSYDKLTTLLQQARREVTDLPGPLSSVSETGAGENVRLKNEATDFALQADGSFSSACCRPALVSSIGRQLRQFNYYVHYNDGQDRRAGVPIRPKRNSRTPKKEDQLDNLRIIEQMRVNGPAQAVWVLETADGKIRLRIGAVMGNGPAAAVEFMLTNIGASQLSDVRLSIYSYIECGRDDSYDYCILDKKLGALLVVDIPTGNCVAMAGLRRADMGYCGTWESRVAGKRLRRGTGVAVDQWGSYSGLESVSKRLPHLITASIPHPPAPYVEPTEPETRTLGPVEATAVLQADWLFQADGVPTAERIRREIRWARELASRLEHNTTTASLAVDLAGLEKLERNIERVESSMTQEQISKLYLAVRSVKRRIMFKNPVVDFSKVLFIDNPYPRGTERMHQARHRDGMMAVPGGRLLVLEGLHPGGKIRKLAPQKPASFWRPDLSFDATKVLFCMKLHDEKSFRLYEINIDGTGLRQLTFSDYDDLDPIYLPDGHIMFSTTRCNTYIRCMPYTYCYILARCDSDGKNIYIISRNNECDWVPTLLNDGRVCYSRWEYHDKALWRIQSLWSVNQDGTAVAAFWGNQSVWPDHLAEPRPIPDSPRVMFTGLAHHNWFDGSIGILDPRKGFNFPHGLTKVTCELPWPECGQPPTDLHEAQNYHACGKFTAYKTPYPLSEDDFLVSARRDDKFRLYLMDVYGNRELIYEGAHHIWHAMPVKPRSRPPVQADRVAWPGTGKDRKAPEPAVFYSPDVYQGVPDLPRGRAKYLRVIQMDARTYSTWTRDGRFSGPVVSIIQDDGVKRILGTVPIQPDGSVCFKAPPGKGLHFQLLDEHFRTLQTMRSFSGAMPGEVRGCLGCHELHSTTPPNKVGAALRQGPVDLTPPPWCTESIGYERFVQPVLDRYCGKCHQNGGKGQKKLDLTLRPGPGVFKEPYLTLVGHAQFCRLDVPRCPGIAGAIMAENYKQSDPASYITLRPMQYLSYTSKLIEIAMSGKHNAVKVDPLSLRRLIAWVDTNCPYRGEEEIRAIPDPNFPGIEYLPIRPRVRTAPVIHRP